MRVWNSQLRAIVLALIGYTCWVLADASMKLVGGSPLPAYEIIGGIGASEVVLLLLASLFHGGPAALLPRHKLRQTLRSCLDLTNNLCVVVAVRHLPLALFYILVFLAPTMTAILAAIFLQEALNWKQVAAILVGFAGVVVAVGPMHATRPGGWIGYLACLICVLCFSVNMVWSRRMTQEERPQSLVFSSGLLMAIAGCGGSLHRVELINLRLGTVLVVTGLFCIFGSLCFFLALRATSAATVSQFHYSQLISGALVAYLGWHEKPTLSMFAGAVLITAAGAYTAARATRADRSAKALHVALSRDADPA